MFSATLISLERRNFFLKNKDVSCNILLFFMFTGKLSQISNLLDLYNGTEDQTTMQRYLTKIQRCLVKSQEYGDEKLQLISQIVEVVCWFMISFVVI